MRYRCGSIENTPTVMLNNREGGHRRASHRNKKGERGRIPYHTQGNTHSRTIFEAGFLENGEEGVLNTTSDVSIQPSRRNLSEATIFVVYAPHVSELTGSDIRPRGWVILSPSVIVFYGTAVSSNPSRKPSHNEHTTTWMRNPPGGRTQQRQTPQHRTPPISSKRGR